MIILRTATRESWLAGLLGLSLLCFLLASAGCAQTRQTGEFSRSGFLKDYSQLREGESGEADLVYMHPTVDFSKYEKVVIDSVTMWGGEESGLSDLSAEERQVLTDYCYHALHTAVAEVVEVVDAPGEGVLRVRAAITDAEDAAVALNVITSTIPQLRLLSTLGGLATDTALIVGKAGLEMELTDSVSDERLAAAVDARVGTKTLAGMFGEWSDVEKAFDAWAERLATRLEELRSKETKEN